MCKLACLALLVEVNLVQSMCLVPSKKGGITLILLCFDDSVLHHSLSLSFQVSPRSGELASWRPPPTRWRHRAQCRAHHAHPPARRHTSSPRPVSWAKHSKAARGWQRAASKWPTVAPHSYANTHTGIHTHIHTRAHIHTHPCLRLMTGGGWRGKHDRSTKFPCDKLVSDRFTGGGPKNNMYSQLSGKSAPTSQLTLQRGRGAWWRECWVDSCEVLQSQREKTVLQLQPEVVIN